MKIIHVIPNLKKGGAERLCIDIARQQKSIGFQVEIITFSNDNEYKNLTEDLQITTIKVKYLPSFVHKSIVSIDEFQSFVNQFKPDIIHAHLYEAELITYHLKTIAKFISHLHSKRSEIRKQRIPPQNKQDLINFFERKKYLSLIKRNDVNFVAISNDCYEFATKNLKTAKKNVKLIPNAINFRLFEQQPKGAFNFEDNKIQLINIGRFLKLKNQIFLIEVLNLLNQSNDFDFHLTFLGDGPELIKVKEQSIKLDLQDKVSFLGIVDNPEYYLKKSHLYIHSSLSEAFGLVFIEAMAAGIPIVTTNGGGNKDIILNNKNGFIFNEHNTSKFSDKILEILKSKKLYNDLSKYSFEYAKQFDISNYADELTLFYRKKS